MFGRLVKVDGWEYFVLCTPDTPRWEVLRRAAEQAEREHKTGAFIEEYRRKSVGIRSANT